MKTRHLVSLVLVLGVSLSAVARDDGDGGSESDRTAIKRCFAAWGKTPFKSAATVPFDTIRSSVKVLGIGRDVEDDSRTDQPKLVLVKPTVNVLTKNKFRLMNPNGWYCFKSNVTVLAKAEITAHCKAHLASSKEGVTIAGGNDGTDGVTVLGKATVNRVDCQN